MKKHFALLAVFFLIGAGCNSDSEITPEPATPADFQATDFGIADAGSEPPLSPPSEGGGPEGKSTLVPKTIQMKSGNFFFDPSVITAEPGQEITIHFTENTGFHTIVIDSIDLVKKVEADGTVTFTAPTEPGDYEFYCNIGSHLAMGMKGTLTVR